MVRSKDVCFTFVVSLAIAFLPQSGCSKKKVVPPQQVATDPESESAALPAPTVAISATRTTIDKGESTVLTWSSQNATSVDIDGGIGEVATSGEHNIEPQDSITYTATAQGAGGSASASVRITVNEALVVATPARPISDSEFFSQRISDIFFDFDMYNLRNDAVDTLNRNLLALNERPAIELIIEGHCDERGSEKYNLALGDRRAEAAKKYLVSNGIEPTRLETVSYGEERPFDSSHGENAWAKNRRAHFVMTPRVSSTHVSEPVETEKDYARRR